MTEAVEAALPALRDRGVLTARAVATVQRWHMILENGDVIALEVPDDAEPDEIVRRFEEALVGRLSPARP